MVCFTRRRVSKFVRSEFNVFTAEADCLLGICFHALGHSRLDDNAALKLGAWHLRRPWNVAYNAVDEILGTKQLQRCGSSERLFLALPSDNETLPEIRQRSTAIFETSESLWRSSTRDHHFQIRGKFGKILLWTREHRNTRTTHLLSFSVRFIPSKIHLLVLTTMLCHNFG